MVQAGDTAFMLVSAALVLLMTPGLALFYGGMVRRKNVLGTIMQSFVMIALVSLEWVYLGYSMSFGPDLAGIVGNLSWAGLVGVGAEPNPEYAPTIPHAVFMIYQCMFAVITPALITGAFAERMRFGPFLAFSLAWTILVYNPVCHWVWGSGGWLKGLGVLDFAGGLVVHLTSGAAALAAVLVIGPRKDHGSAQLFPHNLPMDRPGHGARSGSAGSGSTGAAPWPPMPWLRTPSSPPIWGRCRAWPCGPPWNGSTRAGRPPWGRPRERWPGWPPSPRPRDMSGRTRPWSSASRRACAAISPWCSSPGSSSTTAWTWWASTAWAACSARFWPGCSPARPSTRTEPTASFQATPNSWASRPWECLAVGGYSFAASLALLKIVKATLGLRLESENEGVGLDVAEHNETAYAD